MRECLRDTMRLSKLVIYICCVFAGMVLSTETAHTQSRTGTGVVRLFVTDTAGKPIPDVDVLISDSTNTTVLRTIRVPASGTLMISDLPAGVRYVFQSRKLGFGRILSQPILLNSKDTLEIAFELDPTPELSAVEVNKRKTDPAYSIDDRELGRHPIENLRLGEALGRYRRRILGDPYKCQGQPIENYYVNGIRWSARAVAYPPLQEIFASDIKEVRYINCWDRDFPKLRNSLIIVLKPGVEFPTKNWGEAQQKPTRPPKKPKAKKK